MSQNLYSIFIIQIFYFSNLAELEETNENLEQKDQDLKNAQKDIQELENCLDISEKSIEDLKNSYIEYQENKDNELRKNFKKMIFQFENILTENFEISKIFFNSKSQISPETTKSASNKEEISSKW